ncbi:GckA Putative glycerate kinase [Rhabdaerophilaceae bacterium]
MALKDHPFLVADMKQDARAIFESAVQAVSPATFLPPLLPVPSIDRSLVIFAAGKAAGSMAAATESHYRAMGVEPGRIRGLAIARHGYAMPLQHLAMREAGHPVPDQSGLEATEALIALARTVRPDELVVFLLSGGASANLVAPAGSVTLADKQDLTRQLLRAGVPIDGINTVRKHLSRVKGGRLAEIMKGAEIVTLALSDVPGDDLSAIGSGPTIPDPTSLADARAVIDRFQIVPLDAIRAALNDPANETPKPASPLFARTRALVAARPKDAFEAATQEAVRRGYRVIDLGAECEGEARDIALMQAEAVNAAPRGERCAFLSGGELTVTIRGNGRGGPNQEYALALAQALNGRADTIALAADTDGTDGGIGKPDDPAGAFIDPSTLERGRALGLDAAAMLANNDSTAFFRHLDDLFVPGPTMTNANDLRVILSR